MWYAGMSISSLQIICREGQDIWTAVDESCSSALQEGKDKAEL
jgi:hypothetical protein